MTSRPRIGVVVHFSATNYGNHLVNYATRRILESCGYDVTLLVPDDGAKGSLRGAIRRLPAKLRRLGVRGAVARLSGRARRRLNPTAPLPGADAAELARRERFEMFSGEYLRPEPLSARSRSALAADYARVAIGSDQIWNFDYGVSGTQFADFAHAEPVALSPSVGHDAIPLEWIPAYRQWLSRFTEVGTREIEWTQSLGQASMPRFTLLIDPTLMFDAEDWEDISAPSTDAENKILLYHLGELLPEHAVYVTQLSEHHSLEVLHLSDSVPSLAWGTNASEFIGMIRDAACVVTDSYHGAIFAFLFDKPLVLLERHGFAGSMNTRTRTLTARLQLTDRYLERLPVEDALNHDYNPGLALLAQYRREYRSYLLRHGLLLQAGAAGQELPRQPQLDGSSEQA